MDPECADILREAAESRLRKETAERAIGRAVRRRDMDYRKYVEVVSALRDYAESVKKSADDALSDFTKGGPSGKQDQQA